VTTFAIVDKVRGAGMSAHEPGCFINVRSETAKGASWCGPRTVWQ
jgi:hypothetical protein